MLMLRATQGSAVAEWMFEGAFELDARRVE